MDYKLMGRVLKYFREQAKELEKISKAFERNIDLIEKMIDADIGSK